MKHRLHNYGNGWAQLRAKCDVGREALWNPDCWDWVEKKRTEQRNLKRSRQEGERRQESERAIAEDRKLVFQEWAGSWNALCARPHWLPLSYSHTGWASNQFFHSLWALWEFLIYFIKSLFPSTPPRSTPTSLPTQPFVLSLPLALIVKYKMLPVRSWGVAFHRGFTLKENWLSFLSSYQATNNSLGRGRAWCPPLLSMLGFCLAWVWKACACCQNYCEFIHAAAFQCLETSPSPTLFSCFCHARPSL